jgi:hypothetical protein
MGEFPVKARHLVGGSIAAIAALGSIHGIAQEKARSLAEVLIQDQGMTLVSEGLYARTTPASESYVAVGAAGHAAMLEKLMQLRAKTPTAPISNGMAATQSPLDKAIADLDAMHLNEKQTVTGSCSGPGASGEPELRVIANSSGGTTASASAVMTNDFSPYTNTTNSASASTENRNGTTTSSQSDTEHAFTQASASAHATGPQPCSASGYASVTCPTGGPGISAFSVSYVFPGCVN